MKHSPEPDEEIIRKFLDLRNRRKQGAISSVSNPTRGQPVSTTPEDAKTEAAGLRAIRRLLQGNEPFQIIAKENLESDPRALSRKYLSGKGGHVFLLAAECRRTGRPNCEARAMDKTDLGILQKDTAELFERVESLREQPTITAGVLISLLQYEVPPLLQRAAEIGEPALREFRALERIQGWLMKALLSTTAA